MLRVLGACLLLFDGASVARAEGRAALIWERGRGAEACVGPEALREAAERLAARELFRREGRSERIAFGRIERSPEPPRWRASFRIVDAEGRILGTRSLDSDLPSCRRLDEALAVIVSLLVEIDDPLPPDAPEREETGPPAEIVPPPDLEVPALAEAALAVELPPPLPPPYAGLELSVGLRAQTGLLPGPGVGPSFALRLPLGVDLEPSLTYFAPRDADLAGIGATVHALVAGLAACLFPVRARRPIASPRRRGWSARRERRSAVTPRSPSRAPRSTGGASGTAGSRRSERSWRSRRSFAWDAAPKLARAPSGSWRPSRPRVTHRGSWS